MRLIVSPALRGERIHKEIYGHFSEHLGRCIYDGIFYQGRIRDDVVNAMRAIRLPMLRWPGGCFADDYHWMDGIGKNRAKRPNNFWGGSVEDNSFGTHEFMELCERVGCEPYVNMNVGSGGLREMQKWVEYMTADGDSDMAALRRQNGREQPWAVRFLGIGNENWGGGGNMRPAYYADEYRRYQTFVNGYGGQKPYKIACGAGTSIDGLNLEWTDTLMREAGRHMNGLSLHYYTMPTREWDHKGSATEFDEEAYYDTLAHAAYIEPIINAHAAVMDRYDPQKRVGMIVDEWGTWYDCAPGGNPAHLYQQNTMRDALVAAITLTIFNRHTDRVRVANLAQTVNVLQSIILTRGEQMLLTPTYHVFDLFKRHMDATRVDTTLTCSAVTRDSGTLPMAFASASANDQGELTVTIANLSAEQSEPLSLRVDGERVRASSSRVLTGGMRDMNTFENPNAVRVISDPLVKESAFDSHGTELTLTLPRCSVTELVLTPEAKNA